MTTKTRIRSDEYIARKRERAREKRRKAREALGFKSAAEFRKFAAAQAAKLKAARNPIVIQPSVARRQAMERDTRPGETVEQFMARGGRVDVLPGFQSRQSGPMPVRSWDKPGAWV